MRFGERNSDRAIRTLAARLVTCTSEPVPRDRNAENRKLAMPSVKPLQTMRPRLGPACQPRSRRAPRCSLRSNSTAARRVDRMGFSGAAETSGRNVQRHRDRVRLCREYSRNLHRAREPEAAGNRRPGGRRPALADHGRRELSGVSRGHHGSGTRRPDEAAGPALRRVLQAGGSRSR